MPPKSEGIITKILRFFGRGPPPETPATIPARIKNILRYHWRGLFGVLVPLGWLAIETWELHNEQKKIKLMWLGMGWLFLLRPVNVPVTGLVPIFYIPMSAAATSAVACSFYMTEEIIFFLLSGMLILLLNNSGIDRRIALKIMTAGDTSQFGTNKLIFKCGTAAFVTSAFSSRLIASSMITEYFTKAMTSVDAKYGRSKDEPKMIEVRNLVNNAIQTSSAIGSLAFIHSSFSVLCFRAIFYGGAGERSDYPDIFNYLQYSAFAFPVALAMFLLNMGYFMMASPKFTGKPMSNYSMLMMQRILKENKAQLPPKMTTHEKLTVIAVILSHAAYISRYSDLVGGWAKFSKDEKSTDTVFLPTIKDATVAAAFALLLHVFPISTKFLKYFIAKKRSDLPPRKAESVVLWWKFVDKNLNYAYFYLIGSGIALHNMALRTKLCETISQESGRLITDHPWNISILMVVAIAGVLSNLISSTAACVIFLPFVMCMASEAIDPWPKRGYLGALAVGMATNFGFMYPFLYTPAYFCLYVGKVPMKKMITHTIGSLIICIGVLWAALCFFAPILWDSADGYPALTLETTTPPVTEPPP